MNAAVLAAAAVLVAGCALRPGPPSRDEPSQSGGRPHRRAPVASTRDGVAARRRRQVAARRRRQVADAAEVARWCDDLARATRSGSTLSAAVRTVVPPRHGAAAVERVVLALDRGAPLLDALDQAGQAHGDARNPHLDLALTVLRACARHGGPPAEPIDRAAATLRGRAADAAERRTHSAQARMSAVVMTCLPAAMLALLLATSGPVRAATASPAGAVVVAVGGVLNLAGWRWMRRIVDGGGA